jgi:cytochrome P450
MTVPSRPPGSTGSFLLLLRSALRDPLAHFARIRDQHGDFVALRHKNTYLLTSPDGIKHVLQDNHLNYSKGPLYRKALSQLMGDGLFTAEGAAWKKQRQIAQPAFSRRLHDSFAATINGQVELLRDRWLVKAKAGETIELHPEIVWASLAISLQLVFADDVGTRSEELARAFLRAQREINLVRVFSPIQFPDWFPSPSNLRLRAALRILDDFVYATIRQRAASRERRDDLLSLYLQATEEEAGDSLDTELLHDEMMTLLSAGHDATADAITWTLYLLMNNPAIEQRVYQTVRHLDGRLPSVADLAAMPYLSQVVNESMRLCPPAWGFIRTALGPDTVCGYPIEAGSRLAILPYLVHRDPKLWDNPLDFNPDRFEPERIAGKHRFAFFPFGAGPRQCVGMGMAMLETQLFLAVLLGAFRLELMPGQDIRPLPRISLKPNGPIRTRLHPR